MKRTLTLALLALSLAFPAARAADPIAPEKFAQLHKLIKPQAGEEKYYEIPWQIDLWEARKKAAAEGKPILLWEMDGHPLGCT
ncbi:MAG TPA: hypothetical protein VE988_11820 [Gemmataceae bacterium]|nr:hypothetical protein [Gemmataceae bacterium]